MKSLIIILVFYSLFTQSCNGNDTTNCKCTYYSSFDLEKYKFKTDSICQFLNYEYGHAIMIGHRSFAEANLLFIIKNKEDYRGFFYDLANNKSREVNNSIINKLAEGMYLNEANMKKACMLPKQEISHDFSFFVSFESPNKLYEICYSQILSAKDNVISKLLLYYKDNFK